MNKKQLWVAALTLFSTTAWGINTSTTVEQVSQAVVLSGNVDYHISSTAPFSSSGSVDISNTAHAVLIFDNIKPSLAIDQLSFVTIKGEAARNGVNCQVRIYDNGAMILPYTNDNILTVYSEKGLSGDSCSDFGLGNTGGYMNTLTEKQLNNRIKSFRLKRGYMATFSLKAGGKGYSRCFVAAYNDLEVDLPPLMQNRISSYRIFKWNDVSKKGLANNTGKEYNTALNTQWCYSFGAGEDTGMDRECVPHKIHRSWPSTPGVGALSYSPNLKTSNEPANNSDDTPETVATVLSYWEDLMATGLRLCSPSQHDGGLSWTQEFMDSIDARGWRCDVLDIHCYWPKWNLLNQVDGYYEKYKRPIWISEWLWGASWNKNGVFASSDPVNENAAVLTEVLNNWNASRYVERYAYWNSESKGHLYDNNGISPSGIVYRDSKAGLAYNPELEYIPRAPRVYPASGLTLSFSPNTMTASLKWKENNGELTDSMFLERRKDDGEWIRLAQFKISEEQSAFSYKDVLESGGRYTYRIHTVTYDGTSLYSAEVENLLNAATSLGDGEVQYGTFSANNTDLSYTFMAVPYSGTQPVVVLGSVSNYQSNAAITTRLFKTFMIKNEYNCFRSSFTALTDYQQTDFYNKESGTQQYGSEYTSFIIARNGRGSIGNSLEYESLIVDETAAGKEVRITFTRPFNTIPVVIATPQYTKEQTPVVARVYDVTNTGCKIKLMCQKSVTDKNASSSLYAGIGVFAIAQGSVTDGNGRQLTVERLDYTFKSTNINKIKDYDEVLHNPVKIVQLQSLNRDVMALLRTRPNFADSMALRIRYQPDTSDAELSKVNTKNPVTETIGTITISDVRKTDGITGICNDEQINRTEGIFDLQGRRIENTGKGLPKGLYIIDGKKVVIR